MTIKKHNFSKVTIFGQSESFHLSCASPGWVPSTGYKPLIHLRVTPSRTPRIKGLKSQILKPTFLS